jgi:hypothetical protein
MRRICLVVLMLWLFKVDSFAQADTFFVNGVKFTVVVKEFKNHFQGDKMDTLMKLYRIENGVPKFLLKHYVHLSSSDCNNDFANKGSLTLRNGNFIFSTFYLQTGHDPIPTERKQIYKVDLNGRLLKVYDKQLDVTGEWTDASNLSAEE